jgi:hypothetical protein
MAVLDYIATAADATFAARVAMVLMTLAINVTNEDPTTANHANRIAFAQMHMRGLINCKLLGAGSIAYNTTLQSEIESNPGLLGASIPDSDLTYVISSIYNNFADAYAAVLP